MKIAERLNNTLKSQARAILEEVGDVKNLAINDNPAARFRGVLGHICQRVSTAAAANLVANPIVEPFQSTPITYIL